MYAAMICVCVTNVCGQCGAIGQGVCVSGVHGVCARDHGLRARGNCAWPWCVYVCVCARVVNVSLTHKQTHSSSPRCALCTQTHTPRHAHTHHCHPHTHTMAHHAHTHACHTHAPSPHTLATHIYTPTHMLTYTRTHFGHIHTHVPNSTPIDTLRSLRKPLPYPIVQFYHFGAGYTSFFVDYGRARNARPVYNHGKWTV